MAWGKTKLKVVEPEPAPEAVKDDGQIAWAKLKSQKGWTPETLNLVFYEFIKDRELFKDLVRYAKNHR